MYLCVRVSVRLCVCVSVRLCVCVSVHLPVCVSVCLCLCVCLSVCLSDIRHESTPSTSGCSCRSDMGCGPSSTPDTSAQWSQRRCRPARHASPRLVVGGGWARWVVLPVWLHAFASAQSSIALALHHCILSLQRLQQQLREGWKQNHTPAKLLYAGLHEVVARQRWRQHCHQRHLQPPPR